MNTLGDAPNINNVEEIIMYALKSNNINTDRMIANFNSMKLHITGLRYNNQIEITTDKFLEKFSNIEGITSKLEMKSVGYIMSNLSYFLDSPIAIWEFISQINTVPGFENAICIYENLKIAYLAIIIVPLNVSDSIRKTLWRYNVEVSYTIKNTGNVTQSCPSDECGVIAYNMMMRAYNILKHSCSRNMISKRKRKY